AGRQGAGALVQPGVRPALIAPDHGHAIGVFLRARAQPGAEGFVAPVASGPVTLSEFGGPDLGDRNWSDHDNENYYTKLTGLRRVPTTGPQCLRGSVASPRAGRSRRGLHSSRL